MKSSPATPPRKRATGKSPAEPEARSIEERLAAAVDDLKAHATEHTLKGLARFAIDAPKAIGVSMTDMKAIAKRAGRSHELAAALWREGWYEARMLATLVDDPAQVTSEQMESWAADFERPSKSPSASRSPRRLRRAGSAKMRFASWSVSR